MKKLLITTAAAIISLTAVSAFAATSSNIPIKVCPSLLDIANDLINSNITTATLEKSSRYNYVKLQYGSSHKYMGFFTTDTTIEDAQATATAMIYDPSNILTFDNKDPNFCIYNFNYTPHVGHHRSGYISVAK
jgi:hypothetical protein